MNHVRNAETRDIPAILELLVQVDMVHHAIRPDLFNGPATKYTEEELRGILSDPLGHATGDHNVASYNGEKDYLNVGGNNMLTIRKRLV